MNEILENWIVLREKPNATTLSLEAMILFSNNKTMNWLASKSPEEVQQLLQAARKIAPEFRRLFKERKQNILKEYIKALHEKQHALEAARVKQLKKILLKILFSMACGKAKMILLKVLLRRDPRLQS